MTRLDLGRLGFGEPHVGLARLRCALLSSDASAAKLSRALTRDAMAVAGLGQFGRHLGAKVVGLQLFDRQADRLAGALDPLGVRRR
jgi:hypothetical protein